MSVEHLTTQEAVQAATRCAFHAVEEDRYIIHCFRGGLGADWDLEGVVECILASDDRGWVDTRLGRCLVVLRSGGWYAFDTVVPA